MTINLKACICFILIFVPNRIKIFFYNRFLGGEISKSASIGLSYVNIKKLVLKDNARIGHFNYIRGLDLLDMGENAIILKQNKITAIPRESTQQFKDEKNRRPELILGNDSAIVSNHFLDCNNSITIGSFSIIAGIGTAFFTHSINLETNKQESAPIIIGRYTIIGAQSCILKGAVLPNFSVLAANSTVHKPHTDQYKLYSGVPAVAVKNLDASYLFFKRTKGYVD